MGSLCVYPACQGGQPMGSLCGTLPGRVGSQWGGCAPGLLYRLSSRVGMEEVSVHPRGGGGVFPPNTMPDTMAKF